MSFEHSLAFVARVRSEEGREFVQKLVFERSQAVVKTLTSGSNLRNDLLRLQTKFTKRWRERQTKPFSASISISKISPLVSLTTAIFIFMSKVSCGIK